MEYPEPTESKSNDALLFPVTPRLRRFSRFSVDGNIRLPEEEDIIAYRNLKFETHVTQSVNMKPEGSRLAEVTLVQPTFAEDIFLKEIRPILGVLRWLGLFPSIIGHSYDSKVLQAKNAGWRLFSIMILLIHLGLFGFNLFILHLYITFLGMLHVETMTAILTGLKPLQCTLNLLIFHLSIRKHRILLEAMNSANKSFTEVFKLDIPWKWIRFKFLLITFLVGFIPIMLRLAQYILMGEKPFRFWLSDISIILVGLMSLGQWIPLLYFQFVSNLLRIWFNRLRVQLRKDTQLVHHNITFYYSRYLQLTKICYLLGEFLNPFLFISLATSVVILCLTIYFLINAEMALSLPPNATRNQEIATYFLPGWAGIQILTAMVYILCICMAGIGTNEESRKILSIVLSVMPSTDEGKFQVLCWVQKIQTQYSWCLTIWRAFPIERGLLFTLISIIATYAVVLLKLQQSLGGCQKEIATINSSLFE